jgi:peroxiredoxin
MTENPAFENTGCDVIGVSGDSVEKLQEFAQKYASILIMKGIIAGAILCLRNNISYPLLSDINGEARSWYAVNKALMGLSEGKSP